MFYVHTCGRNKMFENILYFFLVSAVVVNGKDTRVIGGRETHIWNHPYLASIKRISNNEHLCGGAIVGRRHVITSAQCVKEDTVNQIDLIIRVGLSSSAVSDEYMDGALYVIDQIFSHPEYADALTPTLMYHNNIAIIRVNNQFRLSHNLNIIDLPTTHVRDGAIGVLSGWGTGDYPYDPLPKKIRKAWMMIVDKSDCEEALETRIMIDQFCAFQSEGVGACAGDSGSPLVIDNVLVGIVSLFEPCGLGIPDVYIDIFAHIEYINSILRL